MERNPRITTNILLSQQQYIGHYTFMKQILKNQEINNQSDFTIMVRYKVQLGMGFHKFKFKMYIRLPFWLLLWLLMTLGYTLYKTNEATVWH